MRKSIVNAALLVIGLTSAGYAVGGGLGTGVGLGATQAGKTFSAVVVQRHKQVETFRVEINIRRLVDVLEHHPFHRYRLTM